MHGEGQLWKLFHQTFLRMRGDGTEWIFLSIVMDIALYYRLIMKQFIYMSEPSSSWLWSENQIFTDPQLKPKCHYFYSSWAFIQMQQRREHSNNFCLLYMIMVKARRVLALLSFWRFGLSLVSMEVEFGSVMQGLSALLVKGKTWSHCYASMFLPTPSWIIK